MKLPVAINSKAILLAIPFACACSSNPGADNGGPYVTSTPIGFIATASHEWKDGTASGRQTRSKLFDSETALFYPSFGVFTYVYDNSWDGTQQPGYMYNVEVRYTSQTDVYTPVHTYYWPRNDYNIRFYAYAPYSTYLNSYGTESITLSARTTAGVPQLTYAVPADPAQQHDLMVADSHIDDPAITRISAWGLDFRHALTAIQFKVGTGLPGITIKRVTISDVFGKGTFFYRNLLGDGTQTSPDHWDVSASSATAAFSQDLDFATASQQNVLFVSGEQSFVMIPQELPATALITLHIVNADNEAKVLTAHIGGTGSQPWEQGTIITYTLQQEQANDITFGVSVEDWNNDQGDVPLPLERDGVTTITYQVSVDDWNDDQGNIPLPLTH